MKNKITSLVVLALCVVLTVATIANVFGDNQAVIDMAEKVACEGVSNCKYARTSMSMTRTPLGQTFGFISGGSNYEVTCRREFIVFGDYSCKAPK